MAAKKRRRKRKKKIEASKKLAKSIHETTRIYGRL